MASATQELRVKGQAAKAASRTLSRLPVDIRNKALLNIADALIDKSKQITEANAKDYKESKAAGMSPAMLDRLHLDAARISSIAQDVRTVASLPDPLGDLFDMRILPNGLQLGKKRVPLGVIGAIYESRPNVTVDISVLCLKSGNAVILRGGTEAINSNKALTLLVQEAASEAGLPDKAVQLIESTERAMVSNMLKMKEYIDLIVPRGGAPFIKFVVENAAMPVVTGGIGVCHTYVDKSADIDKAVAIAFNAKVQRPTVCNALDTLLVHKDIAPTYLPKIAKEWTNAGVELHCDTRAQRIVRSVRNINAIPATREDWGKEFLALIAAIRVVDSLDEALDHIDTYTSGHSEAIVTEDYSAAMRFLNDVDAACVYVNASTRFTDGGQFGLGAEVGISTQKFHARGPLGLKEITSYKWIILGDGHVRP